MTTGDRGTLHYVNRFNGLWHNVQVTVKKGGLDRSQLHVVDRLKYPGVWDCRKLLGLHEVYFELAGTSRVLKGKPTGGSGANLTVINWHQAVLPEAIT